MAKKKKKTNKKDQKGAKLKELFKGKQDSLVASLGTIRKNVDHAPSMGEVGEKKWRKFLQDHLPARYQVDTAHVISSDGKISEQIDLLIFDRQYSHFAFKDDGLLYVPCESVFAVFELKQNIDKANIDYAAKKIKSVRDLKRTSAKIPQIDGSMKKKTPKKILGGLIALESDYADPFGSSFKKVLSGHKGSKSIEMVFSLKDGLYPKKNNNDLIGFLYELIGELQARGNPPAIDYSSYMKKLK